MSYQLSFIISTRNRLPFLQITLPRLLSAVQGNEEIVVVDGNSTDGSKEYLQQLFDQGKIHQFISEPDHNQAHAWNKGMLMARGQIIKKVIDDDVFDYVAIRRCYQFMRENPQVDVCISNVLNSTVGEPENIWQDSRLTNFVQWKAGQRHVFHFSDVHMLIRKASLSYIGLYDTQFTMMDWEYSLRITYLKCGVVYFTGYNAMSVGTPFNVTSNASKELLKAEGVIGHTKYNFGGDRAEISLYSKFKIAVGLFLHSLKKTSDVRQSLPSQDDLQRIYDNYYRIIADRNDNTRGEFITQ